MTLSKWANTYKNGASQLSYGLHTRKAEDRHQIASNNVTDNADIIARLGKLQPQFGNDCTLAVWNPTDGAFHWITIDCEQNILIQNVLCVVNHRLKNDNPTLIIYIESSPNIDNILLHEYRRFQHFVYKSKSRVNLNFREIFVKRKDSL